MKIINKKYKSPKKYGLGDFVVKNQQGIDAGLLGLNSISSLIKDETASGAVSGLSSGASLGTAIMPGIGTAVGAGLGAIFGGITGASQKRAKKRAIEKERVAQAGLVADQYESEIDTYNENPYGVYKEGGDVDSNIINIEKGELQVNANTGKILRKYNGINPETGGKYEPHNKKGQDSKHNLVNAEAGTFIITTKEAKKYEEAIKNHDKMSQATTMSNIRNKKKEVLKSNKYAFGGDITKVNPLEVSQIGLNTINPSAPLIPTTITPLNVNTRSSYKAPFNFKPNLGNLANYAPAITNIFQGLQTPNYLQYNPVRMNVDARQKTLANMPTEVSINPNLNELRSDSFSTKQDILKNTSNSSIARTLNQQNKANLGKNINNAFINNTNLNTDIKARRASIYDSINQQDTARNAQNAQLKLGVDTANREMDIAKKSQTNLGLSQLQQMYQTLQSNKNKSIKDMETLKLLEQIFPNAKSIFSSYKGGING